MPTLFRFVMIATLVGGLGYWALFVLATHFEPKPREVVESIGTVKIRNK